jgi:hypothetical protein
MVPMEIPQGVDFAARETYRNISMRVIRAYDINNDVFPTRIDILYGTAVYYDELGFTSAAQLNGLVTLAIEMRQVLVGLGLMKGS